MRTRVINIREVPQAMPPDYVYVGRAGRGHDGYFGNPFMLSATETRERVIARFRAYANDRIAHDPIYAQRVRALRGKTLVCFCAPQPCHGDVLAELAEKE
jgi:hypothetical protein